MKRGIASALLMTLCFFCEVPAQSSSTKVERIEIDGKEVRKSYQIFFLSNGKWIEAERTSTGFVVPSELQTEEWLTVMVAFGKYRLQFSEIHISKFNTDWTIGVDEKPFSEEFVKPEAAKTVRHVYYIEFQGGVGLDTRLIVTISK